MGDVRQSNRASERAQSSVLGYVLLVGLVIAVIGTTVAIGSIAYADSTADAEYANVENAMSQFSSKASLVALGESDGKQFSLGSIDKGSVSVKESAGTIRIYQVESDSNLSDEDPVVEESLGSIVYDTGTRELAYQNGGVWSHDGTNSSMVSPPEYYYRGSTLTLPLVAVNGSDSTSGSITGEFTRIESGTELDGLPANPLTNGSVYIEIESRYYEGWSQFLSERTEGTTTRCQSADSADICQRSESVITELSVPTTLEIESGLTISRNSEYDGSSSSSSDIEMPSKSTLPDSRPLIREQIQSAQATNDNGDACNIDTNPNEIGDCTLSNGTYYFDTDVRIADTVSMNTTDGNISVVVNGSVVLGGDQSVIDDSNNTVTYYVRDDLIFDTNNIEISTTNEATESHRQVFIIGDDIDLQNNGQFGTVHAVLFAPNADVTLSGGGNSALRGSLIVNDLSIDGGGSVTIKQDETTFRASPIDATASPNRIRYLHVTKNVVRVELQ